jgi:phosphate transport system substrate-binding protein
MLKKFSLWVAVTLMACLVACAPAATQAPAAATQAPAAATQAPAASSLIKIDGSSTVFPITEAVGEEFQKATKTKVTVGISGTGGGFQKFCDANPNVTTDISDASRPIRAAEIEACKKANYEWIEIPVAYDGLAVVVHPSNTWAACMTVKELKKLWEPEAQGKITKWNQIRPDWPDREIKLYGAGSDSGTFDYFTEAINGKEKASRGDYTPSEDDNTLVQGVAGNQNALGYFGVAYYEENKNKLKLVAIDDEKDDNGKGCQLPTTENVEKGFYAPLARPLFIYVKKTAAERKEIQDFVKFYLQKGPALVKEVGYVQLPAEAYRIALERFEKRKTGTLFEKGVPPGTTVLDILKKAP